MSSLHGRIRRSGRSTRALLAATLLSGSVATSAPGRPAEPEGVATGPSAAPSSTAPPTASLPPDRLRIGALGSVILEVVDPDGRVAGCSFDALAAEEIRDADCEMYPTDEEGGCPRVVGSLADVPAGRYHVRVATALAGLAALAYLDVVEVAGETATRHVHYRFELPPGGRAIVRYEPGATPEVEVRTAEGGSSKVRGEVLVDRDRGIDRGPPDVDLKSLCERVRAQPEPSDEELYERFLRALPPSVADALREDRIRDDFRAAVRNGRAAEVRGLLPAARAIEGLLDSGLLTAAGAGHREVVEVLLDAGADLHGTGPRGESALSLTYRGDHRSVAEVLLERGAEPEGRLLVRAVEEDRTAWRELLRRFGAPVPVEALVDRMERAFRTDADSPDTAALAERVLDVLLADDAWRRAEWDLLSLTACRPDPSLARRLVDRGADLDLRGPRGSSPAAGGTLLQRAVASGETDCVERLLAWGADVNAASGSGFTPLMVAVEAADLPLVRRLLRAGADPSARTDRGRTPLLLLAARPAPGAPERRQRFPDDQLALVDLLLEAGADVDALTKDGESALLAAASQAHVWLVEGLLDRGATLTAETWESMAALHGEEWRIALERLWRERDLPVPSLVELFPPQEAPTADARAQLRTLRDLRSVGTALMAWLTDQVGAAAAAAPATFSVHDFREVSVAELEAMLTPTYLRWIPTEDGWGHPLEYRVNEVEEALQGPGFFLVRSPGRDGRFSGDDYRPGAFPGASYDEDIVFADGFFLRWPQPSQTAETPLVPPDPHPAP